jgi:hypothetical protein
VAEAVLVTTMSVEAARAMEIASNMAVTAIGGGRGRSRNQRERHQKRESKGLHSLPSTG